MERIFENAKFGDRFKTRDGRTAIYIGYNRFGIKFWHQLVLENKPDIDTQITTKEYDNDGIYWGAPKDAKYSDDIVSRLEEPDGVSHSIEERAAERYENPQEPYCFETDREEQWYRCGECDGYISGATEQDRIARQEERERCIKAAQDWCCSDCGAQPKCKIDSDEVGHPAFGGRCMDRVKIRKAIEEGGEG